MRVSNRFFTLIYKDFSDTAVRYAVVVSKKVAPKATERNTMRRRAYSTLLDVLQGVRSGAFIFLMKKDATRLSSGERHPALNELVRKVLNKE